MSARKDRTTEPLVQRYAEAELPTEWGTFRLVVYRAPADGVEHLLVARGELRGAEELLCRVHSECFTGEVLHSLKCDCRDQLIASLERLAAEPVGALVYLRQEGRGIGLGNKVRAYALQQRGLDTVEANLRLGFPADARNYDAAAAILLDQGVRSVALLTNNPDKVEGLERCGVRIARRLPLEIAATPYSETYLETKRTRMGHILERFLS
ncbi:MAG: GTP cyclohydrolase II [Deltaproteobacteria bacterium]|nr:GTP cyclohydrolase II [Deltaproteobacteria bacterium]